MKVFKIISIFVFGFLALFIGNIPAQAAQTLRVQVTQKGDFLLIGNTLGHECAAGTPAPFAGSVGACGLNTADSAPDVFWRSDSPALGQAEANTGITLANARSTAVLNVPPGATVTHAYLYWAGFAAAADTSATLDRPGIFSQSITASASYLFSSIPSAIWPSSMASMELPAASLCPRRLPGSSFLPVLRASSASLRSMAIMPRLAIS